MRVIIFSLLTIFLNVFYTIAEEIDLKKVSFILPWIPQAEFAGYYVAYEKGIYKKYGIDLTIIPGGPDRPASEFLKEQKADFSGIWLSAAIQMRAHGVRLVNIGQIQQKSAFILIAKKSSGISRPEDINGKKVGLWSDYEFLPRMFFKKYNLKVKTITQSSSMNLFLRDGIDVASAMWYDEYHVILNSGYNPEELTTFFFHEHGLNYPEVGIYILEDNYNKDPSTSCEFVKASIEGWKYAFANPEEALDITMKYMQKAYIPANRVHQRWMLARMRNVIIPEKDTKLTGVLNKSEYDRVAKDVYESGLIDKIPPFNSFYKNCINDDKE